MTLVAFIPARSGSKRIPGKNIRKLFGHPLIAYAIQSAWDSQQFSGVYVSSDCPEIGHVAQHYGADWIQRPIEFSGEFSPDEEWIKHALEFLRGIGITVTEYAIRRATSPFITGNTIKRAMWGWDHVRLMKSFARGTPKEKMWRYEYPDRMFPIIPGGGHLEQSAALPETFVQTGGLEFRPITYSAEEAQRFFVQGFEREDINIEDDWERAERIVSRGEAELPQINRRPYVVGA